MPLHNFGLVACDENVSRCHHIYRGAQPDEDGVILLRDLLQVKTIVKLSQEHEFSWRKYQTMFDPTGEKRVLDEPMPEIFRENEADHVVAIIGRIKAAHLCGSVFINCHHGTDRTGLVAAALRMATGDETFEAAMANRKTFGVTALRDMVDFEDHPVLREIWRRVQSGEMPKL